MSGNSAQRRYERRHGKSLRHRSHAAAVSVTSFAGSAPEPRTEARIGPPRTAPFSTASIKPALLSQAKRLRVAATLVSSPVSWAEGLAGTAGSLLWGFLSALDAIRPTPSVLYGPLALGLGMAVTLPVANLFARRHLSARVADTLIDSKPDPETTLVLCRALARTGNVESVLKVINTLRDIRADVPLPEDAQVAWGIVLNKAYYDLDDPIQRRIRAFNRTFSAEVNAQVCKACDVFVIQTYY